MANYSGGVAPAAQNNGNQNGAAFGSSFADWHVDSGRAAAAPRTGLKRFATDLHPAPSAAVPRRPLEELLTALRKGTDLMKHGRHGKPKVHLFRLTDSDIRLSWTSAKGKQRSVSLRSVTKVVSGQTTEIFRRYPYPHLERMSFSLIYKDSREEPRTLDLVCKSEQEFELWFWGIQAVVEQVQHQPHSPALAGGRGALPPTPVAVSPMGSNASGTPMGMQPAPSLAVSDGSAHGHAAANNPGRFEPGPVFGGGQAAGRAMGVMGLPVSERQPGDCYIWGGPESKVQVPGWQHSSVPVLVNNSTHLDVCEVAVGMRHAALVTHGGEMYTWGDGAGGRLGLGNHQPADAPQRVYTLWGKPVSRIAAGDGITAAITSDGALFTWGDGGAGGLGYGGTMRQVIPRQVDKGLRDLRIRQVSCGPYHSAALAQCGQLFTWGDGLCGKLGHGDLESLVTPRQVDALAHTRVLQVACGVWHTAAVARERASVNESVTSVLYLSGPQMSECSDAAPETPASASDNSEEGGSLYTWGGEFTWVEHKKDKAGAITEKLDHHRGCLGHGDKKGRLTPSRVSAALNTQTVVQVDCGLNLTVALTADGKVYQMGETGCSGRAKWEGAHVPEQVGGPLADCCVTRIAVGMQHVAALAGPADKHTGKVQVGMESTMLFTWGRGSEGQLGVSNLHDSVMPRAVEELRGRTIMQVACGGHHTLAVCEHDAARADAEERRRGYKQKMKQWFQSKSRLNIEIPDAREHSTGALTTSRVHRTSGDRAADFALVPFKQSDLAVTPRQDGGSPTKGQRAQKATMMGLARAAVAVRRAQQGRRGDARRASHQDFGAAVRVVAAERRGSYSNRIPPSRRLTAGTDSAHGSGALSTADSAGNGRLADLAGLRRDSRQSDPGSIASAPEGLELAPGSYTGQLSARILETAPHFTDLQASDRDSYVHELETQVARLQAALARSPGASTAAALRDTAGTPLRSRSPAGSSGPVGASTSFAFARSAPHVDNDSPPALTLRPGAGFASADNPGASGRARSPAASASRSASEALDLEHEREEIERMERELEARKARVARRQAGTSGRDNVGSSVDSLQLPGNFSPVRTGRPSSAQPEPASRTGQATTSSPAAPASAVPRALAAVAANGHRRGVSISEGSGLMSAPEPPAPPQPGSPSSEETVQAAPGVFLTLLPRGAGHNQLTRIRFSRHVFSKASAEAWWAEHKLDVAQRYGLMSVTPQPLAAPGDGANGSPRSAGASAAAAASSSSSQQPSGFSPILQPAAAPPAATTSQLAGSHAAAEAEPAEASGASNTPASHATLSSYALASLSSTLGSTLGSSLPRSPLSTPSPPPGLSLRTGTRASTAGAGAGAEPPGSPFSPASTGNPSLFSLPTTPAGSMRRSLFPQSPRSPGSADAARPTLRSRFGLAHQGSGVGSGGTAPPAQAGPPHSSSHAGGSAPTSPAVHGPLKLAGAATADVHASSHNAPLVPARPRTAEDAGVLKLHAGATLPAGSRRGHSRSSSSDALPAAGLDGGAAAGSSRQALGGGGPSAGDGPGWAT